MTIGHVFGCDTVNFFYCILKDDIKLIEKKVAVINFFSLIVMYSER